ncbi:MAG: excinuclease ABC subunit UvrB [Patescibacteria group bacterium]
MFKLKSTYKPTGDQPQAIEKLTEWVQKGHSHQTLLGVTGSGKTFSIANLIQNVQKPTLVISHNKTLAAQLYQEFRDYFPENAVEYFVSYYDYYQPESYIPQTDTYIEKDADINEEIDKLRLSATTSLMTRKDVIVVASVSCIYNLGSPAEYSKVALELRAGMKMRMTDLLMRLSQIYYERNEFEFKRGTYRVRGESVDIFPAYVDYGVRLEVLDSVLMSIDFFDSLTGDSLSYTGLPEERRGSHTKSVTQDEVDFNKMQARQGGFVMIYPAKHYVTNEERRGEGIKQIEVDLEKRLKELKGAGKNIEAYRLEQRTKYDLEMVQEIGYCKGIENYSRYFDGRAPGDAPYPLLDFFPRGYLTVIDESHISIPQIRGMYNGDRSRKQTLIDYGFRLPSALDNRPLNFNEFLQKVGQVVYTSATPDEWEINMSEGRVAEQLVRPTGILDPPVTILPSKGQVDDLIKRITKCVKRGERVLVTTLTKRMAEELSTYLLEKKIKVTYLHSDIKTLERTDILDSLRRGEYDVLVGINLLREGLDLPEVSLVAILDADKEGFLRSQTSLVQTMGRAARHINGEVIMYADNVTGSMARAVEEVTRRRVTQEVYNKAHDIVPVQITKPIREKLIDEVIEEQLEKSKSGKAKAIKDIDYKSLPPNELKKEIKRLEQEMKYQAEMLNFEQAAHLRDLVKSLKKLL